MRQPPSRDVNVDEALRRYFASREQARRIGRKPLSRCLTVFLWGLRVYVLIMLCLIAVTVFTNFVHH